MSFEREIKINSRSSVSVYPKNSVMAPALLANGNSNGMKAKKHKKTVSTSEEQNKTMGQDIQVEKNKVRVSINFKELSAQLATEDVFISGLLANIPPQGVKDTTEDVDDDSEEVIPPPESKVLQNRACDPEELKQRLAEKLSQFKGRKLEFSDKQMKNKLKRKLDKLEKKKMKKRNKKLKSKMAKLAQATMKAASTSSASPASSISPSVKMETVEPAVQSRPPKPIFNSEGRMVFSKFDFGGLTVPTTTMKKTLDPKAALIKIKKVKEKVKHLEASGDSEKAKAIVEKKAWEGALQRAEGVKVKDNAELLAKSIKKREKQKQQSKKKWDERVEAQEKQKEDRQKKRKDNIHKKKNEKKEKKLNRLAKKGKFIV